MAPGSSAAKVNVVPSNVGSTGVGTAESIVTSRLTVGPRLPAASVAVSSNRWTPSGSSRNAQGDVHWETSGSGVPGQKCMHSNVTPGSDAENAMSNVKRFVSGPGIESIVTVGATVSTVTVRGADGSDTLPAASTVRAVKTCGPSDRSSTANVHWPPSYGRLVSSVAPSKILTVPGVAVPCSSTAVALCDRSTFGPVITGAPGATVST